MRTAAELVDGACDELLAGAALAEDEHRHVEPRHGGHFMPQALHGLAVAHQFGGGLACLAQAVELAAIELQLRAQLVHLGRHLRHRLGIAEHHLPHRADDAPVLADGPSVHHAGHAFAKALRLADLGLARLDHRAQPRVGDRLFRRLADAAAIREPEEFLVHRADVADGAVVVGHRDALVRVVEDLFEDVEGEGHGHHEVEQRAAFGAHGPHDRDLGVLRVDRHTDHRAGGQMRFEEAAVGREVQGRHQGLARRLVGGEPEGGHHLAATAGQHTQRPIQPRKVLFRHTQRQPQRHRV